MTHASSEFKAWLGRKRTERDFATSSQAMAMAATLDRDPTPFKAGAALPEFWHWIYFRPLARRSRLGEDGHELRGEFLPPVALPRRMWAGGRLHFIKPIKIGDEITRTSEIVLLERKLGRSGELVLVTVRYIISDAAGTCVEEEQDLMYCEIPKSDAASRRQEELPRTVDWQESFLPDAATLFRYSALTFNAHRIHYDHPFTTQIEGYRGIVVHGPLTALLLLDAAKRHAQRAPASYSYRGLAALFNDEPITLAGREVAGETEVWAAGPSGTLAMQGRVRW